MAALAIVLGAALLATVLHETSHALVARLFGGRVLGVRLRFPRVCVVIDQGRCPSWVALPVALGGPLSDGVLVGAIAMVGIAGIVPKHLALYGLVWPAVSLVVNLLPVPGADGWRAAGTLARLVRAAARRGSASARLRRA